MTEISHNGASTLRPIVTEQRATAGGAGHCLLWIPLALCFVVLLLITLGAPAPTGESSPAPCLIDTGVPC